MPVHKKIRTYTATELDLTMLETIARYHGFSKSATITSLIKREFWRVFPAGTRDIRPERGARVVEHGAKGEKHAGR
ncbi:MAG TPA: hypothetical protein VEW47_06220 [Candidatus Dormibacteraeota bacterium]|jgi:hypothetical protein|nr:hypothetical protein [Candidatus Dormibacteraeota bacterium]